MASQTFTTRQALDAATVATLRKGFSLPRSKGGFVIVTTRSRYTKTLTERGYSAEEIAAAFQDCAEMARLEVRAALKERLARA